MKTAYSILIVDDDANLLELLDARLSSSGFSVHRADNGHKALQIIKSHHIDLVVSDVKMPEMGGMDLLSAITRIQPGLPVILLTAYANIPDAVNAVKAGATDYMEKPFDGKALAEKIQSLLNVSPESVKSVPDAAPPDEQLDTDEKSPAMQKLYKLIKKVASSNVNVLILGESGVGKDRIARKIHQMGPSRNNPFVVVDCGATPAGILESELFGHVKGAFTNAVADKKGLIEASDTGTLFLDEIGNISSEMQTRLLRFLEDRTIRKIGGIKRIPVDCRVISATNANLEAEIRKGRFRSDLFFRLRVVTLTIPPLRSRKVDIPPLVQHFSQTYCRLHNLPEVHIPQETMDWLVHYSWPGNVRELKNAIEGGVVLCRNNTLCPEDFSMVRIEDDTAAFSESCLSLEENEKNTILRALEQTGGIQKEAAEVLGISRRAIHYKIKKYGIDAGSLKNRMTGF